MIKSGISSKTPMKLSIVKAITNTFMGIRVSLLVQNILSNSKLNMIPVIYNKSKYADMYFKRGHTVSDSSTVVFSNR